MKAMLFSFFVSALAVAETAPPVAAPGFLGGGPNGMSPLIPLIVIFAIFYFLMIRPQQRKMKEQQKFLTDLKKGDMVVTNSGIVGLVKQLSDKIITLEIDEGVNLKILRSQIMESANSLKEQKV